MFQSCSFIKIMKPYIHHPYLQALNIYIINVLKKHIPNISEEKISSNIGVLYLVIMSTVKVVIMATVLLEITGNFPFGNCDQFLSEPKNRQATASLFKPKEHRGTFLIYHLLEERIFCLISKF